MGKKQTETAATEKKASGATLKIAATWDASGCKLTAMAVAEDGRTETWQHEGHIANTLAKRFARECQRGGKAAKFSTESLFSKKG